MTQLFYIQIHQNDKELISIYEKAVSEAVELHIFSLRISLIGM